MSVSQSSSQSHRRNNRRDRGRLVPQLLGWGPTMYWSPNFLAVVFKKQEISQQVLPSSHQNAGFSIWIFNNFPGMIPRTLTAGGSDTLPHPTPSRPDVGRKRPGVGTQILVPLNFSAVVAPLVSQCTSTYQGHLSPQEWWSKSPFLFSSLLISLPSFLSLPTFSNPVSFLPSPPLRAAMQM